MNCYPVLVFVHTRLDKLKKCIDSLNNCDESILTELYISSDYWRNNEEKAKVLSVRDYIKKIKGFKNITPIFFDTNVGIDYASPFSIKEVFKKFDSIIIMEDDNEVSPFFLKFINLGIDFYENDPNVFSICGFSPQIFDINYNLKSPDSLYSSMRWAPWGFGITKSKFIEYENFRNNEDTLLILKNDLKNYNFCNKLKSMGLDMYNHFLYCSKNNIMFEFDHGVSYYCLKNNFRSIYNYHSLTKNSGNDGSGLNSLKNNIITNYFNFNFQNVEVNFEESYKIESMDDLWYNLNYNFKEKAKTIFIKIGLFDQIKKIHRKITPS